MATITLNGNTLCASLETGSFASFGSVFTNAKRSTNNMTVAIAKLKVKVEAVCTVTNITDAPNQVKKTEERENIKKSALSLAYDKLNTLISDVGRIDNKVSVVIEKLKNDFYSKYSYLKPECEKNLREKIRDGAVSLWKGICKLDNIIKKFIVDVGEWCKKHWKAIVTVVIVVVAVALVCSGIGGPLGAAAIGALIGATAGGLSGGINSLMQGGSFWEGFENGAFSGAISGAISGAMGAMFAGASSASLTLNQTLSMMSDASLSLGQTVLIGAASSGGSSLLSDLGDKFIKGENISVGDILTNTLFSAGKGAALSFLGFKLKNSFTFNNGKVTSSQVDKSIFNIFKIGKSDIASIPRYFFKKTTLSAGKKIISSLAKQKAKNFFTNIKQNGFSIMPLFESINNIRFSVNINQFNFTLSASIPWTSVLSSVAL